MSGPEGGSTIEDLLEEARILADEIGCSEEEAVARIKEEKAWELWGEAEPGIKAWAQETQWKGPAIWAGPDQKARGWRSNPDNGDVLEDDYGDESYA